ncbi:cysteine proteinase [Trichodelitschia bisporula]|uniref:Cysteine proteinase n=1 Tax=Trichodelitschia bisporula TaxID=703511 RepID=A0A6G1HMM1_9PEZI|nr:cysteine proteinase [Trichodelitschia bisporula]
MSAAAPMPPPHNPSDANHKWNGTERAPPRPVDGTRHIADLQDEAERRAEEFEHAPIRRQIEAAENHLRCAETFLEYRRRDDAFIEYLLAAEICVAIPRNKEVVDIRARRDPLWERYRRACEQLKFNDQRFQQVKQIIINENKRNGIQPVKRLSVPEGGSNPMSRPASRPTSRNGGYHPDELFFGGPGDMANGQSNGVPSHTAQPVETPPQVPKHAPIQVNHSLNSPPPQPPRPSLNHTHSSSTSLPSWKPAPPKHHTMGADLTERFARLRTSATRQDLRADARPDSGSDLSAPLRMPSPTEFVRGPPKVPPRPLPLDTRLAMTMPKPPSPTYSPARNMQTPANVNPPRSTARSMVGTGGRTASVVSNASSRAPDAEAGSYFPPAERPDTRRQGSIGLPSEGRNINANMLLDFIGMYSVLLIDVRERDKFDHGHVDSSSVICIEPLTLRSGMSAEDLENALVLSPDIEQQLFDKRNQFDLVVYYDETTSDTSFLERRAQTPQEEVLKTLFDALWEFNVDRPLKQPPLLLTGGLAAWEIMLGRGALRTSETVAMKAAKAQRPVRKPVPAPPPSRYITMEKRRRREFNPLTPEEEQKWAESIRKESVVFEGPPSPEEEDAEAAFYRTQDDFLRRYPAVPLELESMSGPLPPRHDSVLSPAPPRPPPHSSSQPYSASSQHSSSPAYSTKPHSTAPAYPPIAHSQFPSRPPPAAPRVSYSGAHERAPAPYNSSRASQQLRPYISAKDMAQNTTLPRTGLVNFGVTCYMNATIQCLNATLPLSRIYRENLFRNHVQIGNWKATNGLMSEHFANLIRHLWVGDVQACRPVTFRKFCARMGSQWGKEEQQDAKEFYDFLVDLLHEDLNRNYNNPPAHVLTDEEEQIRERTCKPWAASIEWTRYSKRSKSPVSDLFAGQHMSRLRCLACGHTSTTYEAFFSISVEIPSHAPGNLYNCMASYCKEERLSEADKWKCTSCKRTAGATKQITLTRAPQFLVIHFKRFHSTGRVARKIHTAIDFPLENFDLEPFMMASPTAAEMEHLIRETRNPNLYETGFDASMKPPYKYNAYAVMRHIGSSVTSGHYVAMVRDSGRGCWHTFNDDRVTDFQPAQLKEHQRLQNEQAYIVFFERRSM